MNETTAPLKASIFLTFFSANAFYRRRCDGRRKNFRNRSILFLIPTPKPKPRIVASFTRARSNGEIGSKSSSEKTLAEEHVPKILSPGLWAIP